MLTSKNYSSKSSRIRSLFLHRTFIGIALSISTSFAIQLPAFSFPVGSQWRGVAEGQVFNQRFRLPVVIEFRRPLPQESNPIGLFLGVGTPQQVGNANLFSALSLNTSSGAATLQYLSIQTSRTQLTGRLVNNRSAEAAAANQFYAPNVSAAYAPPIMRSVYGSLGSYELFIFNQGATISLAYNSAGQIQGRIQGNGSSGAGIFPLPPINYQAMLIVERVR